jgi:hypothetical protein
MGKNAHGFSSSVFQPEPSHPDQIENIIQIIK